MHRIVARQELGTGQPGLQDEGPAAGQASSIPREAIIVGIDGGYLRDCTTQAEEVEVVGKSTAEDRDDRCFGLVRSQDAAPKRRLCEVLRRQGLPGGSARSSQPPSSGPPVNLVVSKRFAKRHQMQWSKKAIIGFCRPKPWTPDGTLRDLFTTWYPANPQTGQAPFLAASA